MKFSDHYHLLRRRRAERKKARHATISRNFVGLRKHFENNDGI